jgi:hypothetical protein
MTSHFTASYSRRAALRLRLNYGCNRFGRKVVRLRLEGFTFVADLKEGVQSFSIISLDEPCWESISVFHQGEFPLVPRVLGIPVAGQKLPRFWRCTELLPRTIGFQILDTRRGRTRGTYNC